MLLRGAAEGKAGMPHLPLLAAVRLSVGVWLLLNILYVGVHPAAHSPLATVVVVTHLL